MWYAVLGHLVKISRSYGRRLSDADSAIVLDVLEAMSDDDDDDRAYTEWHAH